MTTKKDAGYVIEEDGSITFSEEPTDELREKAAKELAKLREKASDTGDGPVQFAAAADVESTPRETGS